MTWWNQIKHNDDEPSISANIWSLYTLITYMSSVSAKDSSMKLWIIRANLQLLSRAGCSANMHGEICLYFMNLYFYIWYVFTFQVMILHLKERWVHKNVTMLSSSNHFWPVTCCQVSNKSLCPNNWQPVTHKMTYCVSLFLKTTWSVTSRRPTEPSSIHRLVWFRLKDNLVLMNIVFCVKISIVHMLIKNKSNLK